MVNQKELKRKKRWFKSRVKNLKKVQMVPYPIIRRVFYYSKMRFGFAINHLPDQLKTYITENDFIKWIADDDRALLISFKIFLEGNTGKSKNKMYPFYYKNDFSIKKLHKHKVADKYYEWTCAFCEAPIWVRYDKFLAKNFVCKTCKETEYNGRGSIDRRIIESSIEYTQHMKKIFRKEQKTFLKYIKRKNNENWINQNQ
jgi:hypothetical protein